MDILPTHRIEFEVVSTIDDKPVNLPIVQNPFYLYKEGCIIKIFDINADLEKDAPVRFFEVVDIKHEAHTHFSIDQVAIVYLKEIQNS